MRIALLTADDREVRREYDRPRPFFGNAPAALLEGFAGRRDAEVHVVSCSARPVAAPDKLADNIWFHSLHVPKWGWMRTLYRGCSHAVRRKLAELQPDIVHGQGTERDCGIGAARSGFPNIITIHGHMRAMAQHYGARPLSFHWLAARLETAAVRRAGGVVCLSSYGRQLVQPDARRTWLVPNAVDPSFYGIVRKTSNPPLLVCIGSICREKGQNSLIQALDPVARQHPLRLAFFGQPMASADYGREFHDLVAARPWCEARGFANRTTLNEALAEAIALVHPTLEDNCPMAVLEAMAAGVPVIASRIGGVPDLVTPGHTGWLCDPVSPETFAQAVGELLAEPAQAAAMGAVAREEAMRRFHPRAVAQEHMEIYREVLGDNIE